MSNKTNTDTKVISRVYINIERHLDTETGLSYIERVYSLFWSNSHEKVRETTYGMAFNSDREAVQVVKDSLEGLAEEGYTYDEAEVHICHETVTRVEGTYWNMMGKLW